MLQKRIKFTTFCLIVLLGPLNVVAQQDQAPQRAITQIKGDLYRAQNNNHYTVVYDTDDGVIISDPINEDFANWLKTEINHRFGKPVKYVLYSHYHWDHASGGAVFNDTATFVGHENMRAHLTPPFEDERDTNVRIPDVFYTDNLKVSVGGATVEMRYVGKNHTDDMSVLYFPKEKAVYTVDFIVVDRLPWRHMPGHYPDWLSSIEAVEAMDFDILVPGHGALGTKQDAANHRHYFEELIAAVTNGIEAGKSVEELQTTITLDQYKKWGQYDAWREENIAGTYERISNQ